MLLAFQPALDIGLILFAGVIGTLVALKMSSLAKTRADAN